MHFLLLYDGRSGSTLFSKIITENYNAVVLPETNFVYNIFKKKFNNKKKIIKIILSEKKFFDLKINKNELIKIINKYYPNKDLVITKILEKSSKKIYKKNNLIGYKKNQIEYTNDLIKIFKKMKIIFLIRDPRNIYLSKLNARKIRGGFSKSIIYNIYSWLKINIYLEKNEISFLKIHYENIKYKKEMNKVKVFLNLKKVKQNKFYLPNDQKKIHINIEKSVNFSTNYQTQLSSFKNLIYKIFCYKYLRKYNYEKYNNFLFYVTSTIFSFIIAIYISKKS